MSDLTRRGFLKGVAGAAATTALSSRLPSAWAQPAAAAGTPDKRPNIVVILCDDLGFSDIGCYGSEISTPNLDRLAAGGIRFNRMHNTAKCFPSRACLLTGLYAQQTDMHRSPTVMENCVTFGEALQAAGYRTIMTGKHHGRENMHDRGFDHYWGLRSGACNFFNPGKPREGEPVPAQKGRHKNYRTFCFDEKTVSPFTPEQKDFYTTDYFTNWALDLLKKYEGEDKPFCLYLAYTAPHDPLHAWPADIKKYEGRYDEGFEPIRKARYARQIESGLLDERAAALSRPTYKDWDKLSPEKKKDQARRMEVYAAMIECMDRNIGRVVEYLRQTGELDNTLILFASDNGANANSVEIGDDPIGTVGRYSSLESNWANVGNTPFRYHKNDNYEGGICTPMIAHWPAGIANPGRVDGFCGHFIDVLPTLLDVAGAAYPTQYDGRKILPAAGESFAPVFAGKQIERDQPLFFDWGSGEAVIDENWKLVSYRGKWGLYDLQRDRSEISNLYDSKPQTVQRLKAMHKSWLDRCKKQRGVNG
jgi:arylsulfatase